MLSSISKELLIGILDIFEIHFSSGFVEIARTVCRNIGSVDFFLIFSEFFFGADTNFFYFFEERGSKLGSLGKCRSENVA